MENRDALMQDYAAEAEIMLTDAYNDAYSLRVHHQDKKKKEKIARSMHALKGGAAFFNRDDIVHLCHSAENHLSNLEVLRHEEAVLAVDSLLVILGNLLQKMDVIALGGRNISFSEEGIDLADILSMLPKMAKSVANQLGKQVELTILDRNIRLPKKLVDSLIDALAHLVRNAIDHGIETPDERKAANKNVIGKVSLDFRLAQNILTFSIEDDGRGLNDEAIKKKVLEKNLIKKEELDKLDQQGIWNLIFMQGFSTKVDVTEISGRGVGMDVVKTVVTRLGGKIRLFSVIDQGMKIEVTLPLEEKQNG